MARPRPLPPPVTRAHEKRRFGEEEGEPESEEEEEEELEEEEEEEEDEEEDEEECILACICYEGELSSLGMNVREEMVEKDWN